MHRISWLFVCVVALLLFQPPSLLAANSSLVLQPHGKAKGKKQRPEHCPGLCSWLGSY